MPLSGSVLDGDNVDVRTLSSTEYTNGTLTLNFTEKGAISELKAGTPYIIKWDDTGNLSNPTFDNVTIKNVCAAVTDNHVSFTGFFSPVGLAANDNTVLFLGAGNTLYYPSDDMTIGACRAIFVLNGLTASAFSNPSQGETGVRAFVLNFGDDSEQTNGIVEMRNEEGEMRNANGEMRNVNGEMRNGSAVWYTLDGRKVNSHLSPLTSHPSTLKKGLYINNGKKVVIN